MGYPNRAKNNDTQFNIMALVGNGFDIQVLNEYEQTTTTRYEDFYHFMKMKNLDAGNLVLREMEASLGSGLANWSDVEGCLAQLAAKGVPIDEIRTSLVEVRACFSDFLNTVVSSSLLARLSDDAEQRKWSLATLSRFLSDVDDEEQLRKVPFGMHKSNYDTYNYYFVNFNYTSLLDNYLFMDSTQFDPLPHKTVDTNFTFYADPRGFDQSSWTFASSSYVEAQVVHPHGYQDIPRSLLFGVDLEGDPRAKNAKLAKPYWARAETRYAHLFPDTHLFVVFGSSLGATDSWWWQRIARALETDQKRALMVYWWNRLDVSPETPDKVADRFFDVANVSPDDRLKIRDQIVVVSYNEKTERVWLNTAR